MARQDEIHGVAATGELEDDLLDHRRRDVAGGFRVGRRDHQDAHRDSGGGSRARAQESRRSMRSALICSEIKPTRNVKMAIIHARTPPLAKRPDTANVQRP